jgi:hypothetical protein
VRCFRCFGTQLVLITLLACAASRTSKAAVGKDLKRLCLFYQQLAGEGAGKLSETERYQAIHKRIKSEFDSKVLARQAWEAASNIEPAQRYEAFKSMVDTEISEPFACAAMKSLF